MEVFISFKSFGQTTLYSLDITGNVYNVIILNKNYFLKRDKDLKVKRGGGADHVEQGRQAAAGAPLGPGHDRLLRHPECKR